MCLAGVAGALLGAVIFAKDGDETTVIRTVVVPTAAPVVTSAPVSVAPASVPTPTAAPNGSVTATTNSPTSAPTPDPIVTNDQLFAIISAVSSADAIRTTGTPQNRAYEWIQNVDLLTTSRLRNLQGSSNRLLRTNELTIQRYAMAVFYYSTNGDAWVRKQDWLDPNTEECLWHTDFDSPSGPCNADLIMRHIVFNDNGIGGELPPEIGLFTSLVELNIDNTVTPTGPRMTGAIPAEIRNLANIDKFIIKGHNFNSPLPDDMFSQMTKITDFFMSSNNLTGNIPSSITSATTLVRILLDGNSMTGQIPVGIGSLSGLTALYLNNNSFSGPVPTEIINLVNMVVFWIQDNNFTGAFPSVQSMTKLVFLNVENNDFSGPLQDISGLTSLGQLNLRGNTGLTGEIPQPVCDALTSGNKVGAVECASVTCSCCGCPP